MGSSRIPTGPSESHPSPIPKNSTTAAHSPTPTLEKAPEPLGDSKGTSQWVTLDFPRPVKVSQLHIQFQGGFSSRLCTLEGCRTGEELVKISELYPQDSHAMQRFQVQETVLDKLKITFGSSTDFFGRVVVYHLGVLGERL
ncbi:nuclear receptor 2C2-associated protein [Geospiza fortis]|uniref:Nuclear receptor 2C2-associated protein n=1 Tax=Geospiza fortis TaxID=48883 RepID=A0A6I9ZE90_GEOFO|nr:nuclear receptor 2C2-associated protein [Geospiza fortis]